MSKLTTEKRSAWADHIQNQRNSGITQKAYCLQHGIQPHQFWYWQRKLRSSLVTPAKRADKQPTSAFMPVKVRLPVADQCLSIILTNGMRVEGIDEHNALLAQRLIGASK